MENNDSAIIRAESIYKRFGEKEILRGVSMSVRKGDLKVIIGPSGAGKSTLLQVLNLLVPPTAGQIFLDEEPIDPNNRKALNRLLLQPLLTEQADEWTPLAGEYQIINY